VRGDGRCVAVRAICGQPRPCQQIGEASTEHVWPKWARKLLTAEGAEFSNVFEDSTRGEYERRERQALFNVTVRGICKSCNSGWMNRIETDVRTYAQGMAVGRGRELHKRGQVAIARWGVLKGLVAQRASKEPAAPLPKADYRLLYETKDGGLPDGLTVYTARIGCTEGLAHYGFCRLNAFARTEGPAEATDGYTLTFSLLDVAVICLRLFGEDRVELSGFGHKGRLLSSVRQVWPPSKSFDWPPGPSLDQSGLEALAGNV
jgi:hypothetical protein